MKVYDMQNNDGSHKEYFEKLIKEKNREWRDKKIDSAHYHSQVSLCYSMIYRPEECKMHAELVPNSADAQEKTSALHAVARMLVYEKKIPEAMDYFHQAYALDPEHEMVIEEAGWCCFELKQWEAAQDWFAKGTMLEDDCDTFWEGLGRSLAQQGKYTEALAAFKKALDVCNKEHYAYLYQHLIGQCYASLNDFYRALGCYTKSLDAKPTHADALNDLAALYFNEEGDMTNAIYYLKKAEPIAEKDDNAYALQRIYMNLAKIYGKLKEFELQEHYNAKLLATLGFGDLFGDEGNEGEEDGYE